MFCINYVIKQGDTLYSLSRHYNVPVDTIIVANPFINVYNLRVGDIICIPVSIPNNNYSSYTTYLIEEGDTLGSVLAKNGINLADLMVYNHMNEIYLEPGMTLQVPIIDENEFFNN